MSDNVIVNSLSTKNGIVQNIKNFQSKLIKTNSYLHLFRKGTLIVFLNLVLFLLALYSPKPVIAESNTSLSRLTEEQRKSLSKLYLTNDLKIREVLQEIEFLKEKEGQGKLSRRDCSDFYDRLPSHYLVDLNKEMLDIVLRIASEVNKFEFLNDRLSIASSIEDSYRYLESISCGTKYDLMIAQDFRLKIKIMLLEENIF